MVFLLSNCILKKGGRELSIRGNLEDNSTEWVTKNILIKNLKK